MSRKEYRWMLSFAMVAGLIGGVVSSWILTGKSVFAQKSPQQEKTVTAEDFRLMDKKGKLRARFFFNADGSPALSLLDRNGNHRISVGLLPDGSPMLVLLDKNGKAGAGFDLFADGRTGLGFVDKEGRPRLRVGLMANGDPHLKFTDQEGKTVWQAP